MKMNIRSKYEKIVGLAGFRSRGLWLSTPTTLYQRSTAEPQGL